jgi:hypothetical protein
MSGVNEPPLPGMIRILQRPVFEFLKPILYSQDRTLQEWYALCDEYETWNGSPQIEWNYEIPYTVFHHSATTGRLLRTEIQNQMKLRFIIRKWISNIRTRLYSRRLVGETDLRTLEPIAKKDAIQVFCNRTRTKYQFHVQSIIRMIKENLYYEQWGRADPMEPRNPYTNQPWSLCQLITMIHQIQMKAPSMPSFLSRFVEANYSIDTFYKMNRLQLGIDATLRFFQTPDSIEVQTEILRQLFEQIQQLHRVHLFRLIQRNQCPPLLQTSWSALVQNTWIYDNYGYSPQYMWRDVLDQTMSIQRLFNKSIQWYTTKYAPIVIIALQEPPLPEEDDDADSQ